MTYPHFPPSSFQEALDLLEGLETHRPHLYLSFLDWKKTLGYSSSGTIYPSLKERYILREKDKEVCTPYSRRIAYSSIDDPDHHLLHSIFCSSLTCTFHR